MQLRTLPYSLTVCKVQSEADFRLQNEFYFIAKTGDEYSLVCRTEDTPPHTTAREDGWRAFRIEGTLDFALIGILSKLCGILAEEKIGVFAVSTFNTDYVLVRQTQFDDALAALRKAGYSIL